MNFASIKGRDVANGPGVRVSLFVSGCTHHCEGCFQPETWSFDYGEPFTEQTVGDILQLLEPDFIRGLTLLGGEPMEPCNQAALLKLLRAVKKSYPHKDVWAFTGYTLERDLLARTLGPWEITKELLSYIDVLVDGEFVQEKKNLSLRFRGSENQRLIDLKASLKADQTILLDEA